MGQSMSRKDIERQKNDKRQKNVKFDINDDNSSKNNVYPHAQSAQSAQFTQFTQSTQSTQSTQMSEMTLNSLNSLNSSKHSDNNITAQDNESSSCITFLFHFMLF